MPTIAKDKELFYISNIRQLIAIDPNMSVYEMQRQLAENGLHLDRGYLTKLTKKYLKARVHRMDQQTAKKAVAQLNDVLTETTRRMWPILLDPLTKKGDRIAAAKEIREAHHLAFKLMQETGILEPPKLGTVDVVHHDQTVDSVMADIRKLWGAPSPETAPQAIEAPKPDNATEPATTSATSA